MDKIICGELIYEDKHYYFNFRDNILVIQPEKMDKYINCYFKFLDNSSENEQKPINIEGETNEERYICFINIKFVQLGRGVLQAFVPAYILGETNATSKLIKCDNIMQMTFEGEYLDKLCQPKHIINEKDSCIEKVLKIPLNNIIYEYNINKDIHKYNACWLIPNSLNLNDVLSVKGQLNVTFNDGKSIKEIVNYYMYVEKFFCFINNRKHIKFSSIKLKKTKVL